MVRLYLIYQPAATARLNIYGGRLKLVIIFLRTLISGPGLFIKPDLLQFLFGGLTKVVFLDFNGGAHNFYRLICIVRSHVFCWLLFHNRIFELSRATNIPVKQTATKAERGI